MNTEFRAINQSEIEFELTITMNLEDWKRLKRQLENTGSSTFPAWQVVKVIREMVDSANTHWKADDE